MDAILALRLLAEIYREFGRPLDAPYIDIKAAFDSIDREALCKTLKTHGTPPTLLRLIIDLHEGTTSCVRTVIDDVSDSFPTSSGVHQGCILASALFCCTAPWIMRRIVNALRVPIGSSTPPTWTMRMTRSSLLTALIIGYPPSTIRRRSRNNGNSQVLG